MSGDFAVTGVRELAEVTRKLKGAPKEIRRELHQALNRATAPLKEAARDGARKDLPSRGGLANRVAGATIRAKLTGTENPRLRLEATQTGVAAAGFKKARSADKRRTRRRLRG